MRLLIIEVPVWRCSRNAVRGCWIIRSINLSAHRQQTWPINKQRYSDSRPIDYITVRVAIDQRLILEAIRRISDVQLIQLVDEAAFWCPTHSTRGWSRPKVRIESNSQGWRYFSVWWKRVFILTNRKADEAEIWLILLIPEPIRSETHPDLHS